MGHSEAAVSFVGLGYVGLCTAAVFASKGIRIIGIDIDTERIQKLSKGNAPFHEPRLVPLLRAALKSKRVQFTTDIGKVADGRTTFITVGTPSNPDGSVNLTFVRTAAAQIGSAVRNSDSYHNVVVKSTVIPGTAANVVRPIIESSSGRTVGDNIGLSSNPEFLAEGAAINGTLQPDKIVIGSTDNKSQRDLVRLFKRVYSGRRIPTILTNTTTAEAIKYASNAFLAARVSTINTIANVCQRLPLADVEVVARAIGLDPRIGPLYLKAGPGYGGSCFHKDLQALIAFGRTIDYDPVLLSAVEEVNQRQAEETVKLSQNLVGSLENRRIAVLGLSFKKDTDDIREASSLKVIDLLLKAGANVSAYDPMAVENARKVLPQQVELVSSTPSCLRGADCAILMTEWDEFQKLKPAGIKALMKTPNIVDARRILDPSKFQGFNYVAIGRGTTKL